MKNLNHLIYLTSGTGYTQGVKQIQEHKQYIINNYGMIGCCLGFMKSNIFNFNSDDDPDNNISAHLKELLGHTPFQVAAGSVLGVAVTLILI